MIELGIIVYDKQKLNEVADLIKEYIKVPCKCIASEGRFYWSIPLVNITLMIYNPNMRGYKFHAIYYDERIPSEDLYEVIRPTILNIPRPLDYFLPVLRRQ